jgi:hypothetical protein
MGFREQLSRAGRLVVAELQRASGSPDARSVDRFPGLATERGLVARDGSVDKHYPDRKKLDDYWELYKEIPIIRQPIRSFASEVVGPGYYIDADDEELKEDIEDWLQTSSIVDGEIDRDFSFLLKKAIIQREVKGTVLCEKVQTEDGGIYGFKLMRPETVRAFTKPGQTVLLPPDYEVDEAREQEGLIGRLMKNRSIYTTEDGDVAAFVQVDDAITGSDDGYYIPFTRDDVIKLTRDSDVGEPFGESRLVAVENRLQALLKKLRDNDKAIESLAHPFQLFQFGSEDDPWEPSEIKNFMEQHSQDQFEPGMKQGVQGDMSIETVSGEVAPIEEFLDFDLNWIISEMPMPRYALGGFESEVNQFVSRSQETRLENQIEEARKEIENEFTPAIEEKVEDMGYNLDDFNGFHIGEDPTDLNLVKEAKKEQEGDNIPDGNNSNQDNVGEGGTDFERPPASTEEDRVEDENEMSEEEITKKLSQIERKIERIEE